MDNLLLQRDGKRMAKKRNNGQASSASDLPGVGDEAPAKVEPKPEPQAPPATIEITSSTLTCSVPFIDGLQGYCRRRVDVRLTMSQSEKLRGILQGLESKDARLGDGRHVSSTAHAVQWVIENAS